MMIVGYDHNILGHFTAITKEPKKPNKQKWGTSIDVVFIGRLETDGSYGHMDMYPMQFVVTCVEDLKPLGSFRPLPDQKNSSPKSMSEVSM
jgi:hypothetical protein